MDFSRFTSVYSLCFGLSGVCHLSFSALGTWYITEGAFALADCPRTHYVLWSCMLDALKFPYMFGLTHQATRTLPLTRDAGDVQALHSRSLTTSATCRPRHRSLLTVRAKWPPIAASTTSDDVLSTRGSGCGLRVCISHSSMGEHSELPKF